MMTIPSRTFAPLISTMQATIVAVIHQTAVDTPQVQVTATIHPDRALVPDLAPTAARDLAPTITLVTTIITAANRLRASSLLIGQVINAALVHLSEQRRIFCLTPAAQERGNLVSARHGVLSSINPA